MSNFFDDIINGFKDAYNSESRYQDRLLEDNEIRKFFEFYTESYRLSDAECDKLRPEYRKFINEKKAIAKTREDISIILKSKLKKMFLGKICYIDSNIFMSENNSTFFNILNEVDFLAHNNIVVIKEQYNELYKLKSSNTDASYKARIAFRRIEELHSKKTLTINNLDLKGESYADIAFIDEILMQLKTGAKVSFITEDLDLKIRLNSKVYSLNDQFQASLEIYSLDDIMIENQNYIEHKLRELHPN